MTHSDLRSLRVLRTACAIFATLLFVSEAHQSAAQVKRQDRVRHELLLLDTDVAATKKFATIQNHMRVGQLLEAVDLLSSINDLQTGKLVSAGAGRYVDWRTYANMLAAALPPEGLSIYRKQFDPILRSTFELGRDNLDERALLKVVEQGYCCSFADEALLILGDLAWDEGDIWRARGYWEQLIPPLQPKDPGEPVLLLGYPDSDINRGQIFGRLALVGIETGRFDYAKKIADRLSELKSDSLGHLAGRDGKIGDIILELIQAAERTPPVSRSSHVETFGGSPRRFDQVSQASEFGTLRWQVKVRPFGAEPRRGFIPQGTGAPCYFPVVFGDMLLVHDTEEIYAYNLRTGEPYYPVDGENARIFSIGDLTPGAVNRGFGERSSANIGLPRLTMTIADGRLYVRMGSILPVGGDRNGVLVCLDLVHGDGKLVWNTFATEIDPEDTDWTFEGSPLVIGNRLYVGLRKSAPQPQSNVACFDATTGKLIWNRKLCVGSANPHIADFDLNQQLLTWSDGTLYYATHMGAVAALEPRSGTIKWLVSYPRVEDPKFRHELDARLRRGPLPAMFADGALYVAPLDSDELMAIDAQTGVVKWTRTFQSSIQSLLGVSNGLVYVSGSQLWAVSAQTGRVVWPVPGDRDPESSGFGRGLLVGNSIYWPNHEEILVVDQATGQVERRFPLSAAHGQSGGNLLVIDGYLIVAQPDQIAVFADIPALRQNPGPGTPGGPPIVQQIFKLGCLEAGERNYKVAAEHFKNAAKRSQEHDEWNLKPLSVVARQREFQARLEVVRGAFATGNNDLECARLIQNTFDSTSDLHHRALILAIATEWFRDRDPAFGKSLMNQIGAAPELSDLWICRPREGPQRLGDVDFQQDQNGEPALRSDVAVPPAKSPEYIKKSFPWPLAVHWSRTFSKARRFYSVPNVDPLAPCYVLVEGSPLSCIDAEDGTTRWQTQLAHRLKSVVHLNQHLVLSTDYEILALSVSHGKLVWRHSLNRSPPSPCKTAVALLETPIDVANPLSDSGIQISDFPTTYAAEGLITDVHAAGSLIVFRHGKHRFVALDANSGAPRWYWETAHVLSPGTGISHQNLLVSMLQPSCILSLDLKSGKEQGRSIAESGIWSQKPIVRTDGTFMTIGASGEIASWSKWGEDWRSERGPLAWKWSESVHQTRLAPQILTQGNVSFVLIDGDTLYAVNSHSGATLWKTNLGRGIVNDIRESLAVDEKCIYIPAEGILRAFSLEAGKIQWERYIGSAGESWKVKAADDALLVFRASVSQKGDCVLTICDKSDGLVRQRCNLDTQPSSTEIVIPDTRDSDSRVVRVDPTGSVTLISCGTKLYGVGQRSDVVQRNQP